MKFTRVFKEIKQLTPQDGDIILVRKWEGFEPGDRERLGKLLQKNLSRLSNVTLIFVESLSDVRLLNEKQMREHGWERIQREDD